MQRMITDSKKVKLSGETKVCFAAKMTPPIPAHVAPKAKAVVTCAALGEVATAMLPMLDDCPVRLVVDGPLDGYERYEDAIAAASTEALGEEPLGDFMNYSSGTTGRPKGIKHPLPDALVSDENAQHLGHRQLWGVDEDCVFLSPAPIYHSAPAVVSIAVQALGGTVVMMPHFDPVDALAAIPGLRLVPGPEVERSAIVSFVLDGVHPHDIAQVAGEQGVALRAGHHCCQPLLHHLGLTATARASFGIYNEAADIAALVDAIENANRLFS